MSGNMKILIAYDGSVSADAAIEDLKTAGLPSKAEATVISLADVFLPPLTEDEMDNSSPVHVPASVKLARERAVHKLEKAQAMARSASEQIKESFPGWIVRDEALAESPAWAIIRTADLWKSDLIVVGAQGHAVLGGRLILGSVSQRILYEANCSVRVGRGRHREIGVPLRLLIGVDNSTYSDAAVDAVSRREWPKGTEVRLLSVVDTVMATTPDPSRPLSLNWIDVRDEDNWDQARQLVQPSAAKLRSAGLETEILIRSGNPTNELLEEAESWGSDCIFVGPKGTRGINRLLLGSVSSSVAARAECSVEVVR